MAQVILGVDSYHTHHRVSVKFGQAVPNERPFIQYHTDPLVFDDKLCSKIYLDEIHIDASNITKYSDQTAKLFSALDFADRYRSMFLLVWYGYLPDEIVAKFFCCKASWFYLLQKLSFWNKYESELKDVHNVYYLDKFCEEHNIFD